MFWNSNADSSFSKCNLFILTKDRLLSFPVFFFPSKIEYLMSLYVRHNRTLSIQLEFLYYFHDVFWGNEFGKYSTDKFKIYKFKVMFY